jgi:glycosyltransferase involved in cell wall biosynthesis
MATLGICIPTYRRPDFLRRCVLSALDAVGDRPVRVFIADDSMDDTNHAVYAELQTRSNAVVVSRNPVNLGIDDNIQRAIDLCDCDYAWIVGEDDYFLPGSMQRIHDLLRDTSNPFVFANYVYVGDDGGRVIGQALDAPPVEMPGGDFVARHLWAAGFIGACIVNRRRWGETDPAPYKGTYYTHVGRICELLAVPGAVVHIVAEPCVANRVDGTDTFTWRHDSYGVFFGFKAMCEAVARQFPSIAGQAREAAEVMEHRYRWLSLRVAMRLRSELGYDKSQFTRYLASHIRSPIKRLALYLISIAPPAAMRSLVTAYRRMRRPASVDTPRAPTL